MLRRASNDQFENLNKIAISIYEPSPEQRHCGFFFRFGGRVRHLHFAWHHDLRDESARPGIPFVDPADFEEEDRDYLAAKLSIVKQHGMLIPYGFDHQAVTFDSQGQAILNSSTAGLTCATFVSQLLAGAGFALLDQTSWPHRDDDVVWQRNIVALVRNAGFPDRADVIDADIGAVRVRPEEVAGAATCAPWPVMFDNANAAAAAILEELSVGNGA